MANTANSQLLWLIQPQILERKQLTPFAQSNKLSNHILKTHPDKGRSYPSKEKLLFATDGDDYKDPQLVRTQRTSNHGDHPKLVHLQFHLYM